MSQTDTYQHQDLVNACKKNNRHAQKSLYSLYAKPMFNVCYRIVNQQEEAEDVLQESFVKMFRQIDSYREESSFGAWFKRIVVNTSLNYLKQKKRQQSKFEIFKHEAEDDIVLGEEEIGSINYSISQVQHAMEQLPEGYRVVFSLFLFEDYTHKEIAEELNITESTSKSQLNRAKRKMREILESHLN